MDGGVILLYNYEDRERNGKGIMVMFKSDHALVYIQSVVQTVKAVNVLNTVYKQIGKSYSEEIT